MALLDLLGRRWALRVLGELRERRAVDVPGTPGAVREISSSVLNDRLRELRGADIIDVAAGGYRLSGEGLELLEALAPIDAWAKRWAKRVRR